MKRCEENNVSHVMIGRSSLANHTALFRLVGVRIHHCRIIREVLIATADITKCFSNPKKFYESYYTKDSS